MWQSRERISRGEKYFPPFRRRLIDANASFSKLSAEIGSLVWRQIRTRAAQSWQDVLDLSKVPHGDQYGASIIPWNPRDAQSFYLAQIHPSMMDAMLTGQVALRYHNDPEFEAMAETVHGLGPFAASYLNTIARVRYETTPTGPARNQWAGFGLSPGEIEKVCEIMLDYVNLTETCPLKLAKIKLIDEEFPNRWYESSDSPSERKYLPSKRSIIMIRLWAERNMKRIVEKARAEMTNEEFDEPFPWCFSEAGFGINGKKRTREHHTHQGTNYLFGLFTAIICSEWPGKFGFFGFTINIVINPKHANGSEAITSILNGTYLLEEDPAWTGLNPTLAGSLKIKLYSEPQNEVYFRKAKDQVVRVINFKEHERKDNELKSQIQEASSKYDHLRSLKQQNKQLEDKIKKAEQQKQAMRERQPSMKPLIAQMQQLLKSKVKERDAVSPVPSLRRDESRGDSPVPSLQCDDSRGYSPVPSLQRDDSRDELMEDISDIEIHSPAQILPSKRSLASADAMLTPKAARRGRHNTSPRVIESISLEE